MNPNVWLTIGLIVGGLFVVVPILFLVYVVLAYGKHINRMFEHKPLLVAPKAAPRPDAEPVAFRGPNGRQLVGSYVKHTAGDRRGVVLFCHEYTADRWLFDSYVGYLSAEGFDIFTFDFCNHGESDQVEGYNPLQWVTEFEVQDVLAATDYLKSRPDASDKGIGLFGVSKGGGAGIVAAGRNPYIQAVVTDGAFPTHGTLTYYEMLWVDILSNRPQLYRLLPRWFYALVGELVLRGLRKRWKVEYPRVEGGMRRLGGRSLLMIHGGRDNYIKVAIVEPMFALAGGPKELWVVKGAKHNGCLEKAGDEYRSKVTSFFLNYLANDGSSSATSMTKLVG